MNKETGELDGSVKTSKYIKLSFRKNEFVNNASINMEIFFS